MSRDQEIYREIAQILYNVSLDDSVTVKYKVHIGDVGDPQASRMESLAINADGKEESGLGNKQSRFDLMGALYELRDFFIKNGQPSWNYCELEFNILTKELSTSFSYN